MKTATAQVDNSDDSLDQLHRSKKIKDISLGRSLFLILITICLFVYTHTKQSYAGWFEGGGIGARQLSMGTAAIGLADDWTAIYFNPAGLAFLEDSGWGYDFQLIGVSQSASHSIENTDILRSDFNALKGHLFKFPLTANDEPDYFNQKKSSAVVPSPSFGWYKNFDSFPEKGKSLTFSVGMYSPAAMGIAFEDTVKGLGTNGMDEAYALVDIVSVSMAVPVSVSMRINESFSFGVNMALVFSPMSSFEIIKAYKSLDEQWKNSSFRLFMEEIGYGMNFEAGLLWKIRPNLSLGAVIKAPYNMQMEGDCHIDMNMWILPMEFTFPFPIPFFGDFTNPMNRTMHSRVKSTWHYPLKIGLGLGYSPTPEWKIALDAYWVQWSEAYYKDNFEDQMFQIFWAFKPIISYWELNDTIWYKLGFEYLGFDRMPIRAGCYYDPQPIKEEWLSLGVPRGPHNIAISCGLGYKDYELKMFKKAWKLDLDFGLLYGMSLKRTNPDTGISVDGGFFNGHAGSWMASLTMIYKY